MAVTKPIWTKRLDAIADNDPDYPNMAFEEWYMQGLECFLWSFPRPLVRQAFQALVKDQRRYWGPRIEPWQVRAFVYGLHGGYDESNVCRAPGYVWPLPDDPAWQFVVFVYRDGFATLDWLHPVSCRFWSEDNGVLDMPAHQPGELDGDWLRRMGFDVIREWAPSATVRVDPVSAPRALRPVSGSHP